MKKSMNRPRHLVSFWPVVALSGALLLKPTAADAQICRANAQVGCLASRALCSPVTTGTGSSGHCTSVPGLPPGERECECAGIPVPPAPPLDPGCNDRTVTGKINCRIDKPNVTQHETVYPAVLFSPGDVVDVSADGCVQTGGIGNTWKRYVNPSGPDSDDLYHGLIRIPTGSKDSALVRINSVIGTHLSVSGAGVPLSQLELHLGYEDDDYSDNGYYSHDNGTDDQCRTDPTKSIDGTPAHVTITIYRGVAPDPIQSRFDFDVLPNIDPKYRGVGFDSLDPNGLPFNPQWSWQQRPENLGKIPNTSSCHNFSARESFWGIPSEFESPSFADCTDQADLSTVDTPVDLNETICDYGTIPYFGNTFAGHVNWFPVTVVGRASWGDHGSDNDYTFSFINDQPGTPLGVNDRDFLHVEFDSEETVDYFQTDEWVQIMNAAAYCVPSQGVTQQECDANTAFMKQHFDGHTILTGMFGLDGEHDMKAELHPLYALATLRSDFENDPADEVWLMFVRNQGDEGFCSSQFWDLGLEDYTFKLPWHEGMASVDVDWDKTDFIGSDGTSGPTVTVAVPPLATPGVYVTFHLGPAMHHSYIFSPGASIPFVNGVLHLNWKTSPGYGPQIPKMMSNKGESSRPAGTVTSAPASQPVAIKGQDEDEADETEHKIQEAINHLPSAQQVQFTKYPVMHRLVPPGPVVVLTQPPTVPSKSVQHAVKGGFATGKAERDAAQIRALCEASNNAPVGLPAKACTAKSRYFEK